MSHPAPSTSVRSSDSAVRGTGALGTLDGKTDLLLLAAGLITVAPLLMFLEAGRMLRPSTVGLILYLTPTQQFLLAIAIYHKAFTGIHLGAFGCIWLALALYSAAAWSSHRRRSGGTTPAAIAPCRRAFP